MIVSTLLLAALAGAPADEVVAKVGSVALTRAAVTERAAGFRSQGETLAPADVVQTLVDEVLLAAEGERLGLRASPEFAAQLERARRQLAASALLETELETAAPPEGMLRSLYHASNDFVRMHTLTFETREAAQAARARLEKGAPVAEEAKKAVVAQVHASADAAPYLLRAQVDAALAELVFVAKPGAVVGPVASGPGFAIAQVLDVQIGDEPGFAAKRAELARRAKKQVAGQSRAHLVQMMRAKANVKVDEAFLRGLKGLDATTAELDHPVATIDGRPVAYREVLPAVRSIASSGLGGHMGGPTVRLQAVQQEIDARLLQAVALERGYARRPEVTTRMPATERNLLALLAAERIRASAPAPGEQEIQQHYQRNAKAYGKPFQQVLAEAAANAAAEKREATLLARVQELRRKASVTVDQAALARAVHREN